MTQNQFLFLLASAVGATIIASRGDIFKPFREWLSTKSIKSNLWIHDISMPKDALVKSLVINGVLYSPSDSPEMHRFIHQSYGDVITQHDNSQIRYFIKLPYKADMKFCFLNYPDKSVNAYQELKYHPLMKYITDMLNCPQCAGIWVGCAWYSVYLLGAMNYWGWRLFCFGCITSAVAYMYFKLYSFLEKK